MESLTGLPSDKFYLGEPERLIGPPPPQTQPEILSNQPDPNVSFRSQITNFALKLTAGSKTFFGNRKVQAVATLVSAVFTTAPAYFPEIQIVPPSQQKTAALVSNTVVEAIKNLQPVASLESQISVESGRSFENILSKAYGIPEEHLVKVFPAILKVETGSHPDDPNPMQVEESTLEQELRDFKARVGKEEYDLIFTGQNPVNERVLKGKIRYCFYSTLVRNTFGDSSQETQNNFVLLYYNGGSSITKDAISYYLSHNPEINQKTLTLDKFYGYMHTPAIASAFQDAYQHKYNFKRRPFSKWLENVKHYVEEEKAFEQK